MRQQHRVMSGYREEQCRAMPFNDFVHLWRRHGARPEDARGPDRKRKVHAVAKAIGKKQFGDAETPVSLVDAKYAAGVSIRTHRHVVLKVDTALRASSTAG